jgi:hypothetical protein
MLPTLATAHMVTGVLSKSESSVRERDGRGREGVYIGTAARVNVRSGYSNWVKPTHTHTHTHTHTYSIIDVQILCKKYILLNNKK